MFNQDPFQKLVYEQWAEVRQNRPCQQVDKMNQHLEQFFQSHWYGLIQQDIFMALTRRIQQLERSANGREKADYIHWAMSRTFRSVTRRLLYDLSSEVSANSSQELVEITLLRGFTYSLMDNLQIYSGRKTPEGLIPTDYNPALLDQARSEIGMFFQWLKNKLLGILKIIFIAPAVYSCYSHAPIFKPTQTTTRKMFNAMDNQLTQIYDQLRSREDDLKLAPPPV